MNEIETCLLKVLNKKEYDLLLDSLNKEPFSALRINTLKTTIDYIVNHFHLNDSFLEYGYRFNKNILPLGKDIYHTLGLFYIQEPSAMLVSSFLPLKETDKVLDLCAAPGGKSVNASIRMNNKGLLISNDVGNSRALQLSYNIERMGITNSLVTSMSSDYFSNNYQGYFDKVILDVPCSGLGMARKNEFSKEDFTINKVNKLQEIQKDLILKAYKCLKYEGLMIYSTCTFTKEENEDVINYLLENSNASIIPLKGYQEGFIKGSIRLYPYSFKGEGHFACLIQCLDHHNNKKVYLEKESNFHLVNIYRKWEKDNLNIQLKGHFYDIDNHLYFSKEEIPSLRNVKVLRIGLYLGEVKKDYFIPSHSLALALKKEDFKQVLDLKKDSEQLSMYLKGLTFMTPFTNNYVLVCVDGFSLGLGKASNKELKNLYPKGLRF